MENSQQLRQFMTSQSAPAVRQIQKMVSRVVQTTPLGTFLADKSYMDQAYITKARQNDKKAKPLVPPLDYQGLEEPQEDPLLPDSNNYQGEDSLRSNMQYLAASSAYTGMKNYLKDVPYDGYVQMAALEMAQQGVPLEAV